MSLDPRDLKNASNRLPIDKDVIFQLLNKSNSTCNSCKNAKGLGYVIHRIIPYADGQSNKEENLIVLCPNCHDRAHASKEA